MNSSPEITITRAAPAPSTEKATVPEMFLLSALVGRVALDVRGLRREWNKCTPEQREFLQAFFLRAVSK